MTWQRGRDLSYIDEYNSLKAKFINDSNCFVFVTTMQVIAAEGEQKASRALKEAADVISQSPSALQLRYLQTLTQISAEKNSTIIFPLPVELLSSFAK